MIRIAGLMALMGLVYWAGWKSPWARADMRVRVETPDAPKAVTAPQQAPESPTLLAGPTASIDSSTAENRVGTDQEPDADKREKRGHRRARRREADEQD